MVRLPIKLTVAICTRGRPLPLFKFLDSLDLADVAEDLSINILIIWNDHRNTDFEVLEKRMRLLSYKSKIHVEQTVGLSHARNAALRLFTGQYVYFVDDDVVFPKAVFSNLSRYLHQNQSDIFGTKVTLFSESDINVTTLLSVSSQTLSTKVNPFGFIHGCSMILSRNAIVKTGEFDVLLGAGTTLKSAEDLDYVSRGVHQGLEITYQPEIMVHHNHGRESKKEVRALLDGYAIGAGAATTKQLLSGNLYLLTWHVRDFIRFLRNAFVNRSLEELNQLVFRRFIYSIYGGGVYLFKRFIRLPSKSS